MEIQTKDKMMSANLNIRMSTMEIATPPNACRDAEILVDGWECGKSIAVWICDKMCTVIALQMFCYARYLTQVSFMHYENRA